MVTELQSKINDYIEFKDKIIKFSLYYLNKYYKNTKKNDNSINHIEEVDIILDNNYNHIISIRYTKQCPSYNNITAKCQINININEFEKWYEENFK